MNIDGVEIRTLETKEQWYWFHTHKYQMNRAGILTSLVMENGSLCLARARVLSDYVYKLNEADGEIWPVHPDDIFKEILGLNLVKSGTIHQHLAQVKGEGSNKVPEKEIELGFLLFLQTKMLAHMNHALTVNNGGGIPSFAAKNMNYVRGGLRGWLNQLLNHKDEGERFNKLLIKDKQRYICEVPKPYDEVGDIGGTSGSSTKNMNYRRGEVRGHPDHNHIRKEEGERFNNVPAKDTDLYLNEVFKMYDEVRNGGDLYIGETSGSSTESMNYGRGEVRGHPDRNHIRKNYFASDDEGKYEGLTEAMKKSIETMQKSYEAAMKQSIDNKNVNDEHVIDMPKGPDHNNKKEQANDGDGPFRLCEIGLANTVSLMGSNPPPWATTPTSQRLLGFSGVANAVGYVGTTAALSLRYTKPRAARIFANIGPIGCAWGVIMGFTSYLPGEFQWLGYVAAVFCTLVVLLANY